jgi:hypothetical protein
VHKDFHFDLLKLPNKPKFEPPWSWAARASPLIVMALFIGCILAKRFGRGPVLSTLIVILKIQQYFVYK